MLQTLGPGGSWWRLYLALWRSDFGACGALHCLAASGRCPYLLQPQPFERFPADSAQTPLISLPETGRPGSPPWLGTSLRALKSDPQAPSMLAPLLGIFQPGSSASCPSLLGPDLEIGLWGSLFSLHSPILFSLLPPPTRSHITLLFFLERSKHIPDRRLPNHCSEGSLLECMPP